MLVIVLDAEMYIPSSHTHTHIVHCIALYCACETQLKEFIHYREIEDESECEDEDSEELEDGVMPPEYSDSSDNSDDEF